MDETRNEIIFFINYLKTMDFPNKKYNAIYDYPNTQLINKKYINDFNKKYKKKFLYSHEDKNLIINYDSEQLFNNSFKYISNIQKNLLKRNIQNYISGGAALKLYSLLYKVNNNDKNLITKDYDMYLYYNEKKLNNIIILNKVKDIIDSLLEINKHQNYAFIELYMLLHYENSKNFVEILEIFLNNGFDLFTYTIKNNDIYEFKFLKVINKEFCIRIKLKLLNIDNFIKENIYSYTKLTYYYINKIKNEFKVVNKYIPIEILIKNKSKSNLEIMKSSIIYNNNIFYVYNMNTLLYNLMHLYYKYNHDTENKTIDIKKQSGKDIRDKKRLDLFFKIYCKAIYPELSKSNINSRLIKLKDSEKKFKKPIEKIKDFSIIEKIF